MTAPSPGSSPSPNLGRIGVWSMELRFGDPGAAADAAAELDDLGYGAIWVPGGVGGDVEGDVARLLAATTRTAVATGILNVWKHEPEAIGGWWHGLAADQQSRLMLGLGISHGPLIGEAWAKPITKMGQWLDGIEAAGVPASSLCLAALGPRMLALAGARTAGAHPYLVDVAHTARAREILGSGKLLAPEQGVILETDRGRVRELAAVALTHYARLPNYRNSWVSLGYTDEDIDSQSDRLIDGIFASGTAEQIAARVQEHFAAGASHVCLQVITAPGTPLDQTRDAWRQLAAMLL